MGESTKINLKFLIDNYDKLIIPEIQRDYVMGSGNEKMTKLLDALMAKFSNGEPFDFSCIITNNNNKYLNIYDGQQRLTTLWIMTLFFMHKKNKDMSHLKDKYYFSGRPNSTELINSLTDGDFDSIEDKVIDFTSFSIYNLINKLNDEKYQSLTPEYLMENIVFDMVYIDSQNEIEQFFMDLNSGVKLKEYELFKAKLMHRIVNELEYSNEAEKMCLGVLPYKMDNDWLDFFEYFADFTHPAEEYEVEFIRYCLRMITDKQDIDVDDINTSEILKLYNILNEIIKIENPSDLIERISKLSTRKDFSDNESCDILYFTWGANHPKLKQLTGYYYRGAFWNLKNEDYEFMLFYVIKKVLLYKEKNCELFCDIPLWCYLSSLDLPKILQKEYLKIVKIMLNHWIGKNTDAWHSTPAYGGKIYYSMCSAFTSPQYYGKHIENTKLFKNKFPDSKYKEAISAILLAILYMKSLIVDKMPQKTHSNKKECAILLSEVIEEHYKSAIFYNAIIQYAKCTAESDDFEVSYLGIPEKNKQPEKYVFATVNLHWQTRGNIPSYERIVQMKCETDFLFNIESCENNQWSEDMLNNITYMLDNITRKYGQEAADRCIITRSGRVFELHEYLDDYYYVPNNKNNCWASEYYYNHNYSLEKSDICGEIF